MWLPAWALFMAVAVGPISSQNKSNLLRTKRDTGEKRVVCYYTNWSVYRPGTAKFNPQNINPYLCTHLVYAFGGLSKENSLKAFDKYQDIEQGGYAKFNGLKTYNKNLKTMVAIGGWNEGSARFSSLVADEERRREMVRNVIKFLRQNHFDGLDLDWEYPAFRDGGKPRDRANYAQFVQELREEFDRESDKTGRTRLLLTMAVPAGIEYIDKGYDVPKLNEYLDWFNILSYDYHSAFEPSVDHHAPLLPTEPDDEYNFGTQLNIDATVKHYLKLGAERNKLVLGIPTYGRSYTLFNPDATDIGSPADGPGEQGEATREKGYLAYYEICEKIKSEGWTVVNSNPEAMGPYAYKDNQWVGYDDEEIVKAKSRYVNDNDLGGIMFWSIDNDDFRGKCSGKPYPLIEAAKEALLASSNELAPSERERESSTGKKSESSKPKNRKNRPKSKTTTEASRTTRTTPSYSTTTPLPPTTPDPGSDFTCKDEGFFPHPRDCKKYFWCLDSGPSSLGIVAHQFTCPSGLIFNKNTDSCDYARNVICKNKEPAATTTASASSTTSTTPRTTTARSKVITASPPRHRATTTTTTTEEPEPEEYEDEEGEEEDPNAIKELIGLIKRLGGVEQLEKQLKAQEGSKTAIKTSLFSKVLGGRNGASKYRGVPEEKETSTARYQSIIRSRGPQNSGLENEKEKESTSSKHEKPQYVTIQRNRVPSRRTTEEPKEEQEEESSEEVESPKTVRRPTGTKEYTSVQRSSPRGEETTTTKYKNIFRTRSSTEIPPEDESEEAEEEEQSSGRNVEQNKSKKYSSVYREKSKQRSDDEEEEEDVKVRPQYTTLTRQRPSTSEEPTPVNIVNSGKYVELRRKPETSTVNSIVSEVPFTSPSPVFSGAPQYATIRRRPVTEKTLSNEISSEISPLPSSPVDPSPSPVFSGTPQYATVRRRPVTEETSNEISSEVSPLPPSPVDPTSTTVRSETTVFERRNDVDRKRTRPPILTTQPFVEPTSPTLIVTPVRSVTPTFRSTTPSVISSVPPRRYQFAPRVRPTLASPTPTPANFTIVVPETTIPDWATTPAVQFETTSEEVEKSGLPVTSFQRTRSTTPRVFTTSTETSIVTSITESAYTERQKIMVTKKPTVFKKKSTTEKEKIASSTVRSFFRSTRPYNPRRERSTTTPTSTTTEAIQGRRRFRPRSTTEGPQENSTVARRFSPKKRLNANSLENSNEDLHTKRSRSKFSDAVTEESKVTPKRARSRGSLEVTEVAPKRGRSRGFTTEESVPSTTVSPEGSSRKYEGSFRRKVVARKLKKPNSDLDSQQSASYYDDIDGDLDNKYILGESFKKTSSKDNLTAEVIFATVPTVESEEQSAITQTTEPTTLRSPLPRGRVPLSRTRTSPVPNSTTSSPKSRGSPSSTGRTSPEASSTSASPRSRNSPSSTSATSRSRSPGSLREPPRSTLSSTLPPPSENSVLNVPFSKTVFRGSKKAEDSLIDDVPDHYKKKIRKIVQRRRRPVQTTETVLLVPYEDFAQEDFEKTETTTTTEAATTRRATTAYLQTLRSRARTTTSTTSAPSTERPSRRPGVNLDRRRKFRPERTSATAKPDSQPDGTVTSQRSSVVRRRRPISRSSTTTTTESATEAVEARDLDDADLPDLADPAVSAIHNLAALTSARETATEVPEVREVAIGFSPAPFTASPRPFQETTGRSFTPAFRDSSFLTNAPIQSTVAFRETSPPRVTPSRTIATSYVDFRDMTPPVISTRTFSPSTTVRGVPLESEDTPSTRNEVVIAPRKRITTSTTVAPPRVRAPTQRKLKPFSKVPKQSAVQIVSKPAAGKDYEYYDDADSLTLADVPVSALKVKVHSDGYIECLDQGNFPHPFSCKKFISCAKMENSDLLGWEYTCPKHLSFDPVGGICNWSAGLGCQQ